MTKKLSLIAICAIFSMFFFVSCGSDEDEDAVDTEADTQSDTDTSDSSDSEVVDTDSTTDTTPLPPIICGDNNLDEGELCDGNTTECSEIDPQYTGGSAICNPDCLSWDVSGCSENPTDDPTNPGEGGDDSDPSGNQTKDGAVGAACTRDEDCTGTYSGTYGGDSYEQEAICLTQSGDGFPGGYCSFMCDSTDHQACDKAGGVYHGYNGWGDGFCYSRCNQTSDCRDGYICSEKIHACMPNCEVNECVIGNCDETDKVCL